MGKVRWLPILVLAVLAGTGCRIDSDNRGYTKAPLESTGLWTSRERPMPVAGEPIRQVPYAATQPAQPTTPGNPGAEQPAPGAQQPAGAQPSAEPAPGTQPDPQPRP